MEKEHQGRLASTSSRATTATWPPVRLVPWAARWSRRWRPYELWAIWDRTGQPLGINGKWYIRQMCVS